MEIKRFLGIRNSTSEDRFKPGELMSATDVELDNTGKVLSRLGYTRVSATGMRSLYSNGNVALAAIGSALHRVNPDFTTTQLAALGGPNRPVSYDTVGSVAYWSDGVARGRVVGQDARQWGVAWPVGQPVAVENGAGTLRPGKYMYAMTFLRSDGHESGTGAAGVIELTAAQSGITFLDMEVSTNPEVSGKILYLSSVNGEVLYRVATLPNAQTAATVAAFAGTVPLMTQFLAPPPAGDIVRFFNGCMYVVVGDVVYRSRPYELELFDLENDFLRFPGQLAMFEPVNDGIYVATVDAPGGDDSEAAGDTWYIAGADPTKSVRVFDHGAIPGTSVVTNAGFMQGAITGTDGAPESIGGRLAAVWASRFGICVGMDGGSVENLTESKYTLPVAQRGAGMVRQNRGFTQYVTVLQGTGAANNEYTRE